MANRTFGILMPVSSLPSDEGIGTLGRGAFEFIDYLHSVKASIWQVLPLNPTNYGDSPYQSCSANALNYYFIDVKQLIRDGLLKENDGDIAALRGDDERRVDYGRQFYYKVRLLKLAYSRFEKTEEFLEFAKKGRYADFAVFMALKEKFGNKSFLEWDEKFRTYDENAVRAFEKENEEDVLFWHFTQYIFLKQWREVKEYARKKGVSIMGDIPLYVAYDSAEMWKYGDAMFKVDAYRKPYVVAGCPPDAFTEDGQLWGNPIYDWEKMREDGFSWWHGRINDCFELYDILRIDHFRGFDGYYAIPYGETTARGGHWEDGPKEGLFAEHLSQRIVAEDLGLIDDGVRRLMSAVGYPGMKVLLFAFDGSPQNEHKPTNYTENFVCYTGTHDNIPLKGYIRELDERGLEAYYGDLKKECEAAGVSPRLGDTDSVCRTVMRLAFASRADTVILPMWDILCMGEEARINLPATLSPSNWSWRFKEDDFTANSAVFLRSNAIKSGRDKK